MSAEPPPPRTREELVHRIEDVKFRPVRLREGYDMGEVDRLLDAVVEGLRQGQPVRGMVDGARITPVRLREGYDMGEVDELLDLISAMDGQAMMGSGSGFVDPGAAPPQSPDPIGLMHTSLISEQRGLFSKVFRRNR